MADQESALREEMERIRDRVRLQALAQGLPPAEAETRGQQAAEEFCAKWGLRPDMIGPSRGGQGSGVRRGPPEPSPSRSVDLGSSPLRSQGTSASQPMRISDLLKKGPSAYPGPVDPGASVSPQAPGAPRATPSLSGLLSRVRSQNLPDAPAGPPSPARLPTPAQAKPPASGIEIRNVPLMEQVGVAPPPVPQDRRVALLDEFDRTYSEVQTMLEERIGVVDVALNENPRGLQGAVERAAQPGASEEEVRVLSDYLHRLRDHLGQMLTICDEFLGHIEAMGQKGKEPRE